MHTGSFLYLRGGCRCGSVAGPPAPSLTTPVTRHTHPSGLPGNRTPESFASTIFFSPCSRCKRKVFVHSGLLFMSALFAPSSPLQGEGSCTCVLAGVLAPCRAAQWGLIYEPRSSGRYLPALFTNSVLDTTFPTNLNPLEVQSLCRNFGTQ